MLATPKLVNHATEILSNAGIVSAQLEAWQLLEELTTSSRLQLIKTQLPEAIKDEYLTQIALRAEGIPLQHLTKKAYFRHVVLEVGDGVFIPRPETELVVQAAIDASKQIANPVIVDLCAGSGAITKAILDEVANAQVIAVEVSEKAADYLQRNLKSYSNAQIIIDDLRNLPDNYANLAGCADIVISNPPYIPTSASLPLDVMQDPKLALFSGEDGLDLIRELFPIAIWLLRQSGVVVIEHDDSQRESIISLAKSFQQLEAVEDHDDFNQRPRYLTAIKNT